MTLSELVTKVFLTDVKPEDIQVVGEEDNLVYIIDYKTNKNDIDLDKHYQNQLSSYINALNDVLGIKAIDAKIYHIDC